MRYEAFLALLTGVKSSGAGHVAHCPSHDDDRASLSVTRKDRHILVHCHAGCPPERIVGALGLTLRELFVEDDPLPAPAAQPRVVATYPYVDEAGQLLYEAVRLEPKAFYQRRPDGRGGWTHSLKGLARRVLYRLPELRGASRVCIVEGEKDADRLWSLGLPATTNAAGAGKWRLHADDYGRQLVWAGVREVVLLPDRDAPGWAHMGDVLRACLDSGVTSVRWLALPGLPPKGDVSDWLDAGHTADELRALIEAAPLVTEAPAFEPVAPTGTPGPPPAPERQESPEYQILDGAFHWLRRVRGVAIPERLCNFSARIVEEHRVDDGSGETHLLQFIEGRLEDGTPLPVARVPAAKFAAMNWVAEEWGGRAAMKPTLGVRDRIRYAIQLVSTDVRRCAVFAHTGWRELDGRWVYLSSTGGLGARDEVVVELDGPLRTYAIPLQAEDPREAMGRSLALWHVAPLTVTVPLWAAMFRAPLCEVRPCDFTMWIEGRPNTLKTSTSLLFLSHFGPFEGSDTVAAEWHDTANALERKRFVVKDAPLLIDDFTREADEMDAKARRTIRTQGNRSARARLTAELRFRSEYRPRGLLLVTAETRPGGEGWTARTLVLPFGPATVDRGRLKAAQLASGRLAHAMSGYLAWLAPQLGDPRWRESLHAQFREARERARTSGGLLRVPEIIAHLWLGVLTGLRYAEACGALTAAARETREQEAWQALLGAKQVQDEELEVQSEPRRFLGALWALLSSGQAVLLDRQDSGRHYQGRVPAIGWEDAQAVYLNREVAFPLVARLCKEGGEPLRAGPHQMTRFLKDDGVLWLGEGAHLLRRVRIGSESRRLLCLLKPRLAHYTGEDGWLGTRAPEPPPDWVDEPEAVDGDPTPAVF
jgi:hypothetical protein